MANQFPQNTLLKLPTWGQIPKPGCQKNLSSTWMSLGKSQELVPMSLDLAGPAGGLQRTKVEDDCLGPDMLQGKGGQKLNPEALIFHCREL